MSDRAERCDGDRPVIAASPSQLRGPLEPLWAPRMTAGAGAAEREGERSPGFDAPALDDAPFRNPESAFRNRFKFHHSSAPAITTMSGPCCVSAPGFNHWLNHHQKSDGVSM